MSNIRVRFAPSPTGYVHVGNARTALFNWLFARHHGGSFVLRIEDTDAERSKPEYERQLLDDLRWFGLDWDEGPDRGGPFGPYRQSERAAIYAQHAAALISQGTAYYCFCSAEQLEAAREEALRSGRQPRYSGRCRRIPPEGAERRRQLGEPAAIRLKIIESSFFWNDRVHGPTTISSEVIGDPILVRSEGLPAYNFAVVIDDHLMQITHVIRGDDHISNTPRQLALYRAFGWVPPEFAHLSTILGPDRTRLSKRHGATSMESFREMGILPAALRNYLALLGWSPADGKTEILSPDELVKQFSLEHITKSPAIFDVQKLEWLNLVYVSKLPAAEKHKYIRDRIIQNYTSQGYLQADELGKPGLEDFIDQFILIGVEAVKREKSAEIARIVFDYDARTILSDEKTCDIAKDPIAREILKSFVPKVLMEPELKFERFQEIMKSVERETGKKGRALFHPVRVALTGKDSGPELKLLIPILETGAQLLLKRPVKSCVERLLEFRTAADLG